MKIVALFLALILPSMLAADGVLKLAVTTSFHNSGLADVLLPPAEAELDVDIQLLVVGTGQALKLGQSGDVDAVLVHSRAAEEAFVAEGYATHRREIMYNDFVLIGPNVDPAGIADAATVREALGLIAGTKAPFVSRGDDSGTHRREITLWNNAGHDPKGFDSWYHAVGAGMGAALNTAADMNAYILADRASWLNFGNKQSLALLFSGDAALFNQYAYLPVNPALHSHVNADAGAAFEEWLTGATAAGLIDGYQIDGQQLFVFNAAVGD